MWEASDYVNEYGVSGDMAERLVAEEREAIESISKKHVAYKAWLSEKEKRDRAKKFLDNHKVV